MPVLVTGKGDSSNALLSESHILIEDRNRVLGDASLGFMGGLSL